MKRSILTRKRAHEELQLKLKLLELSKTEVELENQLTLKKKENLDLVRTNIEQNRLLFHEKLEKSNVEREHRIKAIREYIEFIVSMLIGFSCLGVGICELVIPEFQPITAVAPQVITALGFSLLVGPKIIGRLTDILNALNK